MKIERNMKLLFTGDSITDCGRGYPVGMGDNLGDGYVAMVDNKFKTDLSNHNIKILNTGISGNTVVDLESRWQDDVINHKPDCLSVMIGINDVWQQFDNFANGNLVEINRYEQTYRTLLSEVKNNLAGLVIMSPYYIEPDKQNPIRKAMDAYGNVAMKLAKEFDATFVNVQTGFDIYLKNNSYNTICDDHVHPNHTGHQIIATSFLNAIKL